jgi:NAD(P)-dependent dehydrogenase (short-subunit alcohol dehydrogenase family)
MIGDGHDVILHARSSHRAADIGADVSVAAGVVVGDLADPDDTAHLAAQVNAIGPVDCVIHNAGVYVDDARTPNSQGRPRVLAVNVLAPYLLTALIDRPARLVYLSSGMHRDGRIALDDLDWTTRRWNGTQAYCDSKLYVTALALAVANRWPDTCSNAVDPGWVPTRMGGPAAPDDLQLGHQTQTWLATSDDPAATTTGRYWFHRQPVTAAPAASDPTFQHQLLDELTRITGQRMP